MSRYWKEGRAVKLASHLVAANFCGGGGQGTWTGLILARPEGWCLLPLRAGIAFGDPILLGPPAMRPIHILERAYDAMAGILRRPDGGSSGCGDSCSGGLQLMRETLPGLGAFLGETSWDDGSPRLPGSLTLFCEDGVLKCCLSDKDLERIVFVSVDAWEGFWETLSARIERDAFEWRRSPAKRFQGKK